MPTNKPATKPADDAPIDVEVTKTGEGSTDAPNEDAKKDEPATPKATGARAHEAWARDKGFTPQFNIIKGQAPGLSNKRENKKHWQYAAAKGLRAWVVGKEVTETEFDKAVIEACGVAIR